MLHRLRSLLRLARHDAACGDWLENDPPPDSFVREPRQLRPNDPTATIALELPPDFT
jgi:hypothetical protein